MNIKDESLNALGYLNKAEAAFKKLNNTAPNEFWELDLKYRQDQVSLLKELSKFYAELGSNYYSWAYAEEGSNEEAKYRQKLDALDEESVDDDTNARAEKLNRAIDAHWSEDWYPESLE